MASSAVRGRVKVGSAGDDMLCRGETTNPGKVGSVASLLARVVTILGESDGEDIIAESGVGAAMVAEEVVAVVLAESLEGALLSSSAV